MVLHFGNTIRPLWLISLKAAITSAWKCSLIILRCIVLLLFYWSWSCPVLIQLCIITSTPSLDSGLEVLTVSCNIWVVLVACIRLMFDYVHCLFLLFLSLVCFFIVFNTSMDLCVWNKLWLIDWLNTIILVVDEHNSFSAVDKHIFPKLSRRFLNALTVDASMTCCGKLFQSLTTLLEKNVRRTVVTHLGLKSFCRNVNKLPVCKKSC